MSDSRSPTPTRFQEWLQGEMDARDWTQAKLGRELDIFKGTIGRWLFPQDHPRFRKPSYESLRLLADLFAVDIQFLLDAAEIDHFERETNLSQIQKNCIAAIQSLPDDVLESVYAMLRGLMDAQTARERRADR